MVLCQDPLKDFFVNQMTDLYAEGNLAQSG